MRRIMLLSGLPESTIFFHVISYTDTEYEKKVIGHKMCVLIISSTFVCNILILRRTEPNINHKCTGQAATVMPLLLDKVQ
jgi:hypothetical protein